MMNVLFEGVPNSFCRPMTGQQEPSACLLIVLVQKIQECLPQVSLFLFQHAPAYRELLAGLWQ